MVIAYHLIWTAYGTWLPNDLRGSGSRAVRSAAIAALGPVHFGRKRVQPARAAVRKFYERAAEALQFPLLRFGPRELEIIGAAIGNAVRTTPYTCYACAIMPDHVHLVIRKHRHAAEEMINRLQEASRAALVAAGLTSDGHPVWTDGGWKVFLDSPAAVRGRVAYVDGNPGKEGMPRQVWPFVTVYDGWGGGG